MIVLGIDSSTQVNTVALIDQGRLLAETIMNTSISHSQRLMPMIDMILKEVGINITDIDGVAVSSGPGSFTGLRIGMTSAKAIAWATNKPLVGVPTLDGIAYNAQGVSGIICPILNARRNQVYASLYRFEKGELERICEYMAIEPMELIKKLHTIDGKITLLGDAIEEFATVFEENLADRLAIPTSANRLPRASQVAYLGWIRLQKGEADSSINLSPLYIRKADAELKLQQRKRSTINE